MKHRVLLFVAGMLACGRDSITGPFGLELREGSGRGSVAAAIRRETAKHPDCPLLPSPATDWTSRPMATPHGRVFLPPRLRAAPARTSEITFFAPDLSAGAFVSEAPSLASLEVPKGSPLSREAITGCRVQQGNAQSLVYLISQSHPARVGDSVHLAFLQVVAAGGQAVRAGAFATTRALRDSLIGALLAFEPDST